MQAVPSTSKDRPITPEEQKGSSSRAQQAYSSPIKATPATIDRHKRDEWSKHIYPGVHTEITAQEMIKKLVPTSPTLQSENKVLALPKKRTTKATPKENAGIASQEADDEAPRPPRMKKTVKGE